MGYFTIGKPLMLHSDDFSYKTDSIVFIGHTMWFVPHNTTKNHHQKTVHFQPELGVQFAPEYPQAICHKQVYKN